MSDEPQLAGVQVIPLKRVVNPRGWLQEIQRNDDPHYPGFGQLYFTCTLPGVTKAWYRHHIQVDQITLVAGELLLALYDTRPDSPTRGHLQEIRIHEAAPKMVQIPPGVWHGFQAIGQQPACLAHLNTVPFDAEHPDEDRLPSDDLAMPYCWPRRAAA